MHSWPVGTKCLLYCTEPFATCDYRLNTSILMIMMTAVTAPLVRAREDEQPEMHNLPKEGPPLPCSGLNIIKMIISMEEAIKHLPAGS